MSKKFYFATLVIAALSFTGCANDEYVGDQQKLGEQNGAIAFSTKSTNTVRATLDGSNAAGKLNGQFWVYGTKTVGNNAPQPVFKDYKVVYSDVPTTSPSNTKGWEYVGIPGTNQTIKYWDYSAKQYDFQAYSINGDGTVTRNTNSEYIVDNISQNGCANLYFADKKTVLNTQYNQPVQLDFKSVLSKIRVGFYETIPGYSVNITKFYGSNGNADGWGSGDDQKFVAWCPNKKIDNNNQSFVVQYETATPAVTQVKQGNTYQPILSAPSTGGYTLDKDLTLGGNLIREISTETSAVTWDQSNGGYTYFIPQNAAALCDGDKKQVKEMKIKVDYTLTSTDGSGEVINVTGATAIVPAEYLKWKPNTAYSYVFKISDQTNGNTGGSSGPAGLYPITFDAVVEQMEDYRKDYLTTVSDLSITATQDGPFADADKAVFKKGQDKPIKVKVMRYNGSDPQDITNNVGAPTNEIDKFEAAFVTTTNDYNYNLSPEQNLPNGTSLVPINQNSSVITLDGQTNAGFWIVKVTYKDGEKIITKYAVLKVETVPTPPSQEGGKG